MVLVAGFAFLCACHSNQSLTGNLHSAHNANWGVNAARSHYYKQVLQPPLELVWKQRCEAALGKALSSDGQWLYAGLMDGQVDMIRLSNGKRVRRCRFIRHSEATTACADGKLIVALRYREPSLQLYDPQLNKVLWQQDAGELAGEPLILDSLVYIVTRQGMLGVFNLTDGHQVLSRSLKVNFQSGPSADDARLYLAGVEGQLWALDKETLKTDWQVQLSGRIDATPVISKGLVLVGTRKGYFHALDAVSGKSCWMSDLGGAIFETAASTDSAVYVGTARGRIMALNLTQGNSIWCFETGNVIGTAPVIAGDVLYVGTLAHQLLALDVHTGHKLWHYQVKGRIRTTPLVVHNCLYVASESRTIYALRPSDH
jgi:outer membrane protein assembly factor BamB